MVLRRRTTKVWLVVAIVLAPIPHARAQNLDKLKVRRVQAAYLFNFAKFIDWPKAALGDKKTDFVIGVLGDDQMASILESTLKSKTVESRSIVIRRFRRFDSENYSSMRECQILYVGKSQKSRLRAVLRSFASSPILLVSEISGFAGEGGMVGFVLERGRIVFEINRKALERVGLRASFRLLSLARLVIDRQR